MKKIFKLFEQSDKQFVVFDFERKSGSVVSDSSLIEHTEGTQPIITKTVNNAWLSQNGVTFKEDGSLELAFFVKDTNGTFHRLDIACYPNGEVGKSSIALGTNNTLIKKQFGEGLFD